MPNTNRYEITPQVSIGEASRIAGVSISTLRRWERDGIIKPQRTPGGQRRYRQSDVEQLMTEGPQRSQEAAS
ncbi:MerR family DNA-binding transcriptional regulator [Arthrobacter sp. HLT1-21]